ncbi:MAG: hypothetical protein CMO55_10385 [Verrucomicrobiales bacterium]|nr:hypothetical protein [Verrucomicrobiales bacterium]
MRAFLSISTSFVVWFSVPYVFSDDPVNLSESLKGRLVGIEEMSIVEVELTGDPEYFVFYHSASW